MAIKVITGAHGSGKTIYSVVQVIQKYFSWNDKYDEWEPKQVKDKLGNLVYVQIWSNIDGLKLPHINLPKYLKERDMTYDDFFCEEYAEKIMEKYGVNVFVIDEVQSIFREGLKNEKMAFWHEYHRHWGFDIYYSTQDLSKLSKYIINPIEVEIRALKRHYRISDNVFTYKLLSDGNVLGKKRMVVKPHHWALYKSTQTADTGKAPRLLLRIVAPVAILLVLGVGGIVHDIMNYGDPPQTAKADPPAAGEAGERGGGSPTRRPGERVNRASLPPAPEERQISVEVGSLWISGQPAYISMFGETYSPSDLPYPHHIDYARRRIRVTMPASHYAGMVQHDLQARAESAAAVAARKTPDAIGSLTSAASPPSS